MQDMLRKSGGIFVSDFCQKEKKYFRFIILWNREHCIIRLVFVKYAIGLR